MTHSRPQTKQKNWLHDNRMLCGSWQIGWNNERATRWVDASVSIRLFAPCTCTNATETSSAGRPPPSSRCFWNGSFSCGERRRASPTENKQVRRLLLKTSPPRFVVLSRLSWLSNQRLSRWGFDGAAVLILSPQKLWRCHTIVVMDTTMAEGNPSWRDETIPRGPSILPDNLSQIFCTAQLDTSDKISDLKYIHIHMHAHIHTYTHISIPVWPA